MTNSNYAFKPIHKIDVVVHIDPCLNTEQRSDVEREVLEQKGIMCVNFNQNRGHLLLVGYDANLTTSAAIVQTLHQHNIRAELVGGL